MSTREHPIPFSDRLVDAILGRRKTQTRRIPTPQNAKYQPGDRLWVKERAVCVELCGGDTAALIRYTTDGAERRVIWPDRLRGRPEPGKTLLARFMHREASRILLAVERTWLEHIRDITEEDAIAEGVKSTAVLTPDGDDYRGLYAKERFADLWNETNGARGYDWASNPEVRVIQFKVLEVQP